MSRNVGNADRAIRIIIGLILLSLPLWLDASWSWFGLIGLIPVVTGLLGRCPAYRLIGLNTCPVKRR